jgi:hypothetical protein
MKLQCIALLLTVLRHTNLQLIVLQHTKNQPIALLPTRNQPIALLPTRNQPIVLHHTKNQHIALLLTKNQPIALLPTNLQHINHLPTNHQRIVLQHIAHRLQFTPLLLQPTPHQLTLLQPLNTVNHHHLDCLNLVTLPVTNPISHQHHRFESFSIETL